MKKYIWTIAASIMIAGVITIVACSKDNETEQSINPTFSSTKGGTTLNQLRNVMVAYYAACDSAYQADSTTFLYICDNNDTTSFLNITGISVEMIAAYRSYVLQELNMFLSDNPNFKPEYTPNNGSLISPLQYISSIESATSGHMAELVPSYISEDIQYLILNYTYNLQTMNSTFTMTACIAANIGEYYKLNYSIYRLRNALFIFNSACDSAYQSDSIMFGKICEDADLDEFDKMVGVSSSLLNEICLFTQLSYQQFVDENPDYKFEDTYCSSCTNNPLSQIAYVQSVTHGHTADLLPEVDRMRREWILTWNCWRMCTRKYGASIEAIHCMNGCELEMLYELDNLPIN